MELVVTLLLFMAAGFGAAALLRIPLPTSVAARASLLFLLGVGINGAVLFAAGVAGVPLNRVLFFAVPLGGLLAGIALRGRTVDLPKTEVRRHAGAAFVFAVPLLLMVVAAAVMPLRDYDGRATWIPKAKAIAFEGSVSGPFFQGNRGLNLHNRYPLLTPLNAAAVMVVTGDVTSETPRWLFVITTIAALLLLRSLLVSRFDATGAWVAAALPWLPVLWSIEGGAFSAYSDLPLAAFACAAFTYVAAPAEERTLRGAAWFAAFAVLTKNEGVPLAAAIGLAALVSGRIRSLRRLLELALPVLGGYALLTWWHTLVPEAYDHHYGDLLRSGVVSAARIIAASRAMMTHAFALAQWGGFWIAFLAAGAVALFRRRWAALPPLAIVAIMGMTALAALTVTSWDVNELAKVTVSRLLSQVLAPASFVIAMGVDSLRRPA